MPDSVPAPRPLDGTPPALRRASTVVVASDNSAASGLGRPAEAGLPMLRDYAAAVHDLAGLDAVPLAVTARDARELSDRLGELPEDVAAIFLTHTDPARARTAQCDLAGPSGVPVITDQETTGIALTAALLTALVRAGVEPAQARVVIAGSEESPVLGPLLVCAGIGDLMAWNPWDATQFPLHSLALGAHAVLDLTGGGYSAALAGLPVIAPEPGWALLALPGLLSALVHSPWPIVDLSMIYHACARALALSAGPGQLVPGPADPGVTSTVAHAAGHALHHQQHG